MASRSTAPPPLLERIRTAARLARGMVHEAKNSLNVIALHLQALTDKVQRTLPSERAQELGKHLGSMRDQLHKLDRIISRFGGFVAQSHRVDGPCDLSAALADAVSLCEHDARKQRLQLETQLAPGVGALADRNVLEAALVELLLALVDGGAAGLDRGARPPLRLELLPDARLTLLSPELSARGASRARFEQQEIGAKVLVAEAGRLELQFRPAALAPAAAD
ncbi:MAG: hypothetical protein ACYCWW_15490 [Deltaproteobacteria bacterium]